MKSAKSYDARAFFTDRVGVAGYGYSLVQRIESSPNPDSR